MSRTKKHLAVLLAVVMVLCLVPAMVFGAGDDGQVVRISGNDRYATSAETALEAFPDGAETVIIARGDEDGNFADGLAASYLAGVENAPILLTRPNELPDVVKDAIIELGAENAIILGGPAVITNNVTSELTGLDVERIYGANRYETAAKIAAEGGSADTAFVVSGYAPADSLVAGPLAFSNGYPVLLADDNNVNFALDAIEELGIENIIVVGGTGVVTENVYNQLAAKVDNIARFGGQNRVETSLKVVELYTDPKDFSIVGYNGLADAVGAAVFGNPIIYVSGEDVSNIAELESVTPETNFFIFGGTGVVSGEVEAALGELLVPEEELKVVSIRAIDAETGEPVTEVIGNGTNKVRIVAEVDNEIGVVRFDSTLPTLSQEEVTLQNGKATIDFTPLVVSTATMVKINAKVIAADNADLIGKQDSIEIKVIPVTGEEEIITKKVITAANAEYADRVTLYTNTSDFDLSQLDPGAFVVQNRGNEEIGVSGFIPHPSNEYAFIAILDVDTDRPMTDNSRHSLVINEDRVFEDGEITFDLVDANHPKVLEVTALDQVTLQVRFNEPVAAGEDTNCADNRDNYLIDGRRLSGINDSRVAVGTFDPATGVDQRHIVTITLPVGAALAGGNHSLQVANIGDWASLTDMRNVLTTQTIDFNVVADTTGPVAKLTQQSPEQYLVKFNEPIVGDPEFRILNKPATQTPQGANAVTLTEVTQVNDVYPEGLKVTDLGNNSYLIELTQDWTQIYNSRTSGVNYWASTVNPYVFDISGVTDRVGNPIGNDAGFQQIQFTITRDISSPLILDLAEQDGLTYIEDNLAQQRWLATTNEPVQIPNAAPPTDPLTPSEQQEAADGVPTVEVEFTKGDLHIDGVISNVAEDDYSFEISPSQEVGGLEAGEWTVTIKALSDDVGNTNLTQQFKVTVYPQEPEVVNPTIEWADAHYDINGKGEVHVMFNKEMAVTGLNSVLKTENWNIDGYSLPVGSDISVGIDNNQNGTDDADGITISLPKGWLENNVDRDLVLNYSTLKDAEGKVLKGGKIVLKATNEPNRFAIYGSPGCSTQSYEVNIAGNTEEGVDYTIETRDLANKVIPFDPTEVYRETVLIIEAINPITININGDITRLPAGTTQTVHVYEDLTITINNVETDQ